MKDFDICSNIGDLLQQQVQIRDLLSMLRYSQNRCNNVDCVSDDIQLPQMENEFFDILSLIIMTVILGAIFSFVIRPNFLKKKDINSGKNDHDDNNDNSPSVPPVS